MPSECAHRCEGRLSGCTDECQRTWNHLPATTWDAHGQCISAHFCEACTWEQTRAVRDLFPKRTSLEDEIRRASPDVIRENIAWNLPDFFLNEVVRRPEKFPVTSQTEWQGEQKLKKILLALRDADV